MTLCFVVFYFVLIIKYEFKIMKILSEKKKLYSSTAKITEAIKNRFKGKEADKGKVDLSKLAKDLAEKREKVLAADKNEEENAK